MSVEFCGQTLFLFADIVISLVMAERAEGEVFLMNKDAAQRRAGCGLKIEGRNYNTRLEMVNMLSLDERRVRGVLGV